MAGRSAARIAIQGNPRKPASPTLFAAPLDRTSHRASARTFLALSFGDWLHSSYIVADEGRNVERFLFRTIALGCAAISAGLSTPAAADGGFAPRVIYVAETGAGERHRFQLVVANADGRDQRVVASSREPLMAPAWSPDGRQVAYVGYQHGSPEIYVRDLQTGSVRRLVDQPGVNGSPAWSPDGKSLALCLSIGGNRDIYVIDLDTGASRRLTDDAARSHSPPTAAASSRFMKSRFPAALRSG